MGEYEDYLEAWRDPNEIPERMNLTVKEAKEDKKRIEDQIFNIVNDFELQTGLEVTSIVVERKSLTMYEGKTAYTSAVRVNVKL